MSHSHSHFQVTSSILSLDPSEWPSASLAAIEAEKAKDFASAQRLQLLICKVITEFAAKEQRIASILAKNPVLDPSEIAFSIFRIERLAKLFDASHQAYTLLRIQVQNNGWPGFKSELEHYDFIAANSTDILNGVTEACSVNIDYQLSRLNGCTLRETLDVMAYIVDTRKSYYFSLYPEYQNVPRMNLLDDGISTIGKRTLDRT